MERSSITLYFDCFTYLILLITKHISPCRAVFSLMECASSHPPSLSLLPSPSPSHPLLLTLSFSFPLLPTPFFLFSPCHPDPYSVLCGWIGMGVRLLCGFSGFFLMFSKCGHMEYRWKVLVRKILNLPFLSFIYGLLGG